MQEILSIPVPYFVLILEVFVITVLITGWLYGSRRMNFKLHHRAVYFVALVHLLTVGIWMIPRALSSISFVLANPQIYWYLILHDILGISAIILGIVLSVIFLVKGGMPLKLLKRTRPFMFLTIGLWTIAFLLGVYWVIVAWVLV